MLFRSYSPAAPLCEFVDDFWLYEDYAGDHSWERILPSGTFEMVFNLREDEFRIYSSSDPHEGLDVLIRTHGRAKVRDIARAVDLSPRRFIEVFTAEVGLTPKLFGRVQRFQHAFASSRNTAKVNWAQLALDVGYFDQSHLIHEFVEFSGLTPVELRHRLKAFDHAGAHVKRHHLPLAD